MSDSANTVHSFDVFLSFRGPDTRRTLISFLYSALVRRNIRTFKDDEELENGRRFPRELQRAIEESKFAVVVVSVNYAESSYCLDELVKIMDFERKGLITVMPIFYGVDPCDVRRQNGKVAEQFKKHESREEDHEKVLSWKQALTDLANISGDCSSKWDDDSKMVDEITDIISKKLMNDTTRSNGSDLEGSVLEGIDAHMKALLRLLDLNSKESVRVIGIWARGGTARSALAKFVYQNICRHFDSHCFLESVKRASQDCHMSHLHEKLVIRRQGERLRKLILKNKKVLLVADDVNKLERVEALAEDFNYFGPGSIVIITTQDRQLLISSGIKLVYEVELLRFQKVCQMSDSANTVHSIDVFLISRGLNTRHTFISFLYKELVRRNIRTFKDDEDLENGQRILPELKRAIERSKIVVVVVSVNYAESSSCLEELVEIMDFAKKGSITVMPIFYGAEQFKKHEARVKDHEKVLSWR